MEKNPKVDALLENVKQWKEELIILRNLVLDCGLNEEIKWGVPCYTFKKKSILILHGFKEYVAVNLFNGALLEDTEGILVQQTENVQAARQIRFTNPQEIKALEATIKAYIFEALEAEKAGIKVQLKKTEEFNFPEELESILKENTSLRNAFENLTPGRQRGYLLHFSGAKQSATRTSRIEKCIPKILAGKGFNDCTCGLSKRMPTCDGSHKILANK